MEVADAADNWVKGCGSVLILLHGSALDNGLGGRDAHRLVACDGCERGVTRMRMVSEHAVCAWSMHNLPKIPCFPRKRTQHEARAEEGALRAGSFRKLDKGDLGQVVGIREQAQALDRSCRREGPGKGFEHDQFMLQSKITWRRARCAAGPGPEHSSSGQSASQTPNHVRGPFFHPCEGTRTAEVGEETEKNLLADSPLNVGHVHGARHPFHFRVRPGPVLGGWDARQ